MTAPTESDHLRPALVTGLRRVGCGRICRDEPNRFHDEGTTASKVTTSSIFLGLILFLITFFDLGVVPAVAIVLGSLFMAAVGLMVRGSEAYGSVLLFFVLLWLITFAVRAFSEGVADAVVMYGVPFIAVTAGLWMWRVVRLAAEIPLMLPVALIVVVFPLLSADVWQLGNDLGIQLASLAAVSVLPLLGFVLGRLLRLSIPEVFVDTAGQIEAVDNTADSSAKLLEDLLNKEEREAFDFEAATGFLRSLDSPPLEEGAVSLATTLQKSFRRRILLRVIPLTLGIAIAVAAFIYILAMASVPMETAQQWAGSPIPTGDVSLAAIDITLPLGPYLMVPALLAVIATAVFLAFVLTEDRYSVTLYDTLVYEPARRWILLGVPYGEVRARWGGPDS